MFQRLLRGRRSAVSRTVDALYAEIVAAARHPVPYAAWGVPDTPLGRFEMICLHMILLQRRLLGETGDAREIAQQLIDEYFTDVEHSLRELGIGDLGVPKRMKKLARMHFGRTAAYAAALDSQDQAALTAALARNIRPEDGEWPGAAPLADHVLATAQALAVQESPDILAGHIAFPAPDAHLSR
jgi:cytochrome b pre-mRNA-processing protein 3